MKLKAWLREQKGMSYSEYRAMPEFERYSIYGDFLWDNRCLQKKAQAAQKRIQAGWRPMTEEERKRVDELQIPMGGWRQYKSLLKQVCSQARSGGQ